MISNDELLYDPDLDDKDEAWVSKQIESKYIYMRKVWDVFSLLKKNAYMHLPYI